MCVNLIGIVIFEVCSKKEAKGVLPLKKERKKKVARVRLGKLPSAKCELTEKGRNLDF